MKQKSRRAWDTDNGSLIWVEADKRYTNDDASAINWWE